MEYLTVELDGTMEFGSGTDLSSSSVANDAAFEQLLRLAASYPSHRSAATIVTDGQRGTRKNPIAEDIELRAYHIYLQRGGAHGRELEDWLQAERQVLEELKRDKASFRVALAFGLLKESADK